MIDIALKTVRDDIQTFLNLKAQTSTGENKIILGTLEDSQGKNSTSENALIMSLIKIEEERTNKAHSRITSRSADNEIVRYNPPLNLNLYILFAAKFSDYPESLKFISHIISYFQVKPVFTSANTPCMEDSIGKLSFEIFNQDLQDLSYLWGMMGSSYLPSVLYKMRMIIVQEAQVAEKGSAVNNLEPSEVKTIS